MNTRWWATALTLLAILFVAGYAVAPWLAGPADTGSLAPADGPKIQEWVLVDDFDQRLALFPTVFWDPRDSFSLRELIRESDLVRDKTILEIGTGSGLISLCCLKAGASHVVATDVNPQAVSNARYNASRLELIDRLDARQVPLDNSGAFSVIEERETFDLIISNPPWVNQTPESIDEYALYDANFDLMRSLFEGIDDHLKPGGTVLLAYGCVDAIRTLERFAEEFSYDFIKRDDRELDDLPEEFLPGMLIEIRPKDSNEPVGANE